MNALKSTGPRTEAGKARVRLNALKHGLTGEGVALPDEDLREISERFVGLQEELRPKTQMGKLLVRRAAFLSVRLERCERFEVGYLSKRVRHAEELFDNARLSEMEAEASHLTSDPVTASRRLQTTPEGIDRLLFHWADLRAELMYPDGKVWTSSHTRRCEELIGKPYTSVRVSRLQALAEAYSGFFPNLRDCDGEGLNDHDRAEWAKREIAKIIDAEVDRLKAVRAAMDPQIIAKDRAEAASRLLFDPSPELILARKYEAATERGLYKALKEFQEVERVAEEAGGLNLTPLDEEICNQMALNFRDDETAPEPEPSEPEGVAETPQKPVVTLPEPVGLDDYPCPRQSYAPPLPTNQVPITVGRGKRARR